MSRGYHNLTARYNVLFNGQQSFDQGQEDMRESLEDDFTKVLPMFAYAKSAHGQVPGSKMNRAVRKGHKLIDKHSITVKPDRLPRGASQEYREFYNQREFNRWVDESWMLIGKAHIYSHNWHEGLSAFDMVLQTFPDKKVRFKAILWMARAYIETGNMESARLSLERYSSEVKDEEKYYVEAMSTYAWYWIVKGDFEKALEYCRMAAKSTTDRWQKIRWNFVLGQVAEKNKEYTLAREAYETVEKMNPDYEFAIHARVKVALLEGGPDNPEQSRKALEKYAGEYKNLDYRGQIYYAIAQTWFWEGDTLNALTNLQLAAGYGGGNKSLSGSIYKRMADVYFQSGDYVAANAYYDSTLTALPEGYPGLYEISKRKDKLEPLAINLNAIQYEDSVQRIAAMPQAERDEFLDNLLVQLEQEEEQKQFQDQTDDAFFYRNFANRGNRNTDESGKWYFYNQTMVSLGEMEFEKRWGRRELEDNWRRTNKEAQVAMDQGNDGMMPSDPFGQNPPGPGQEPQEKIQQGQAGDDMPDKESLEAGLPLTSPELQASHLKIQSSLFSAGHVLAHNFDKQEEAIEMFERLLSEYPQTKFREQTLMGIYMACREISDNRCTQHYGQVITDDYPDSRFAAFIQDPQYFEKQEVREEKLNDLYEDAFNDFQKGSWSKVINKTEQIIGEAYDSLMPQSFLLSAAAYSQTDADSRFKNQLTVIVNDYPNSSQATVAQNWLNLLEQGRKPQKITMALSDEVSGRLDAGSSSEIEQESVASDKFVYEPDSLHYLYVVMNPKADINQLLFNLANFNFDRFVTGELELSTFNIGNLKVLETGPFRNRTTGLDYFFALIDNPSVFKVDESGEPQVLLISRGNKKQIKSAEDVEGYRTFFLENYLPGSALSAIIINESEIPDVSYVEQKMEQETEEDNVEE
uniref:type IX secretion system periplasmic lipoprotein PorW/SprE n=1 Tax=Marinilabilia rubra TaxID=2162893 RepID=UPI001E501BFA|nr:tetratricopeptide repeat protein [Marinilabilia rubra]